MDGRPVVLAVGLLILNGLGCATAPRTAATAANPVFVRANNPDAVWERAVDVLHANYFEIAQENRLDGRIETDYKTGAGVLEPWHHDSVGWENRLESTLQSIRRKAYIGITPADGGYFVSVEVFKELEDVQQAANSAGSATFLDNSPLQRNLTTVVGQASPSGWIPKGRDPALESLLLSELMSGQ